MFSLIGLRKKLAESDAALTRERAYSNSKDREIRDLRSDLAMLRHQLKSPGQIDSVLRGKREQLARDLVLNGHSADYAITQAAKVYPDGK